MKLPSLQSMRLALLLALVLGALAAILPAHAEDPAKAPAKEPAKTPASADCSEAAVEAAAAKLSEDDERTLAGLSIGEGRIEEEEMIWGGAGEAVTLVGAFQDASCFELLLASCGPRFSPCSGPFKILRVKDGKLETSLIISGSEQVLSKPENTFDFNHDGQHEILAATHIVDTSNEGEDVVYAELYQIRAGKVAVLWGEPSSTGVFPDNVSVKDTNGDKIDELIVKKDGKEEIFFFDGTTFKTK